MHMSSVWTHPTALSLLLFSAGVARSRTAESRRKVNRKTLDEELDAANFIEARESDVTNRWTVAPALRVDCLLLHLASPHASANPVHSSPATSLKPNMIHFVFHKTRTPQFEEREKARPRERECLYACARRRLKTHKRKELLLSIRTAIPTSYRNDTATT